MPTGAIGAELLHVATAPKAETKGDAGATLQQRPYRPQRELSGSGISGASMGTATLLAGQKR